MKKLGIILATGLAFTSCQHFEESIGENSKNIKKNTADIVSAKKDRDALYVKVFDVEKKAEKNTSSIKGIKGDIATLYKSAVKYEESASEAAAEHAKIKRELEKARREHRKLHKEIHALVDGKGHKHKHDHDHDHDHGKKGHDHDHGKKMSKESIDRLKKIEKDLEKAQKELEELRIILSANKKSSVMLDKKLAVGGQSYDEVSKLKAAQQSARAEREEIKNMIRKLDNELAAQIIEKDSILKQQAAGIDASLSLKSDVSSLKKKLLI